MTAVSSRAGGDAAESAVLQLFTELRYVPDTEDRHIDAETVELLEPSDRLQFSEVSVLKPETAVEIKSVMVVVGENQVRGRFYLRQKQHERLSRRGGSYLFAVCEPTPSRDVIAAKIVPATAVDRLISSWIDVQDEDRAEEAYAQLAWSRIFDVEAIEP